MRYDERTFKSDNGVTIYQQQWLPDSKPRALICLVHGFGEHSGRYNNVIDVLVEKRGLGIFSFDLRGHGKSSGTRGDLRFPDALDDIEKLVELARKQYPDVPVVLYGHSTGGLLTLLYVLDRKPDVAGHVATAPLLDTKLREQTAKVVLANLLGSALPSFTLPAGTDASMISRDEAEVEKYRDDPLVHDQASFAFGKQMLASIDEMQQVTDYPVPLLLMHGSADVMTVPEASREFVERVEGDLTLYQYEGLYHELHHEPEKDQVLTDLADWLDDLLAK